MEPPPDSHRWPIFVGYGKLEDLAGYVACKGDGRILAICLTEFIGQGGDGNLGKAVMTVNVQAVINDQVHYWRMVSGEYNAIGGRAMTAEAAQAAQERTRRLYSVVERYLDARWHLEVVEAVVAAPRGLATLAGTSDHVVYLDDQQGYVIKEEVKGVETSGSAKHADPG